MLVVAWIASYFTWASISVAVPKPYSHVTLHQIRGHVELNVFAAFPHEPSLGVEVMWVADLEQTMIPSKSRDMTLRPPPFTFKHFAAVVFRGRKIDFYTAGVPHWLLIIMCSIWPAIAAIRRYRAKHADHPQCHQCGYDLRGNPDAATCPECGAASVG